MKNTLKLAVLSLAAAGALSACNGAHAATAAAFTGPRAEVALGVRSFEHVQDRGNVVYTGTVGYDVPVSTDFIAGVEGSVDNAFDGDSRGYSAAGRLGYAVRPNLLAFGRVGYNHFENASNFDLTGLEVGGGLECNVTNRVYVNTQYRYTDYSQGAGSHGVRVGVGLRF
jgi:outer membrane immunogenic protein